MQLGVVGLGYWGPNIVRNALENPRIESVFAYDRDPEQLARLKARYHDIQISPSYEKMLASDSIEAVAIVTPVSTHHDLARKALEAGKHLIVEKPFTASVREAQELVDLAAKKDRQILVDHTFVYTSAVRKIRDLIDQGILGKVYYYDSVRVNLGLFQHDVNVIWDLAPHDFSIMDYLIRRQPVSLCAMGAAHIDQAGLENMAYVYLQFEDDLIAHFHVNWLSPVKLRRTLIGGSGKMIIYDDVEPAEKVKVYDKGVTIQDRQDVYKRLVQYRSGDVYIPHIENVEALKVMMDHFVDCLARNEKPITDGEAGLRVVRLLEASQKSIQRGGEKVII